MINGQKVLGLIAARGGSKGVPGKNLREVGGKPLIFWTINAGKSSKYLDRLIVSSDDDSIIEVAKSYDCEVPFKRKAQLSKDDTPSVDVVLDAINRCPGFDMVVLLQPTSPLRTSMDIDCAIEKCIEIGSPACVSVCKAEQSPYWMYYQKGPYLQPVIPIPHIGRRQELPQVYVLNGSVFVAQTKWLYKNMNFITTQTAAYVMPIEKSLDLNTEEDFNTLKIMLRRSKLKKNI